MKTEVEVEADSPEEAQRVVRNALAWGENEGLRIRYWEIELPRVVLNVAGPVPSWRQRLGYFLRAVGREIVNAWSRFHVGGDVW